MPVQAFDSFIAKVQEAGNMGQATDRAITLLQIEAIAMLGRELSLIGDTLAGAFDPEQHAFKILEID